MSSIAQLKQSVNCPPNSLANFSSQQLLNYYQGQYQVFLISLCIVDVLPLAIFNQVEQVALTDFCHHQLHGFVIETDTGFKLLPLLKQSCFIALLREKQDYLKQIYTQLAERFLAIDDIKSAIGLMLQIGEKAQAVSFLSRMGGLLEWIRHGLANLMALNNLFSEKDIEQYVTVAWLNCVVNYKLGNVTKARQIINLHWQKNTKDQFIWVVADAMIKLNQGKIFNKKQLSELYQVAEIAPETNVFTHALINNLLSITWLQMGKNDKAQAHLLTSLQCYQLLTDAQYGQSYIKVHQIQSAVISGQFNVAKQLVNRVNTEIHSYFRDDKSIRLSAKINKLELNYQSGLLTSIRTIDKLITQLDHSESWFDSYATLYVIAVKNAIIQKQIHYIEKWFSIVYNYFQHNPMEYIQELLNKLARLVCYDCPELTRVLNGYINEQVPLKINKVPWRIQALKLELMWQSKTFDEDFIVKVREHAKKHQNTLLYFTAKITEELSTSAQYLSHSLIEALSERQLIALLLQASAYIPAKKFHDILRKHNRVTLLAVIENNKSKTTTDLSKKEQQVYQLLTDKLRNKEIALALGISEQTVKFHLKNIYRKLGVKSRKQAISLIP